MRTLRLSNIYYFRGVLNDRERLGIVKPVSCGFQVYANAQNITDGL
jgi:hypothetical protein